MSAPKKRTAAAEVFRQQNMMMPNEAEEVYEDNIAFEEQAAKQDFYQAQSVSGFAAGSPLPPPAPAIAPMMEAQGRSLQPLFSRERSKKRPAPQPLADALSMFKTSEELQLEKEPLRVRETGFWMWKRVIVPPNAYVVHTRIGRKEPVTLGLGISFRYNPYTDAYLIVPAAMQTIGVVSNCISKEKQGLNVLAYVQWQIAEFAIAYKKLDFSDSSDPLGIVNAQLREQADAAIKDKIATMSVDEVLTDKAPVIEELTRRLTEVSEGRVRGSNADDEGLGIKIVTVQIKEAYVSSQSLWENLQAPFRHERERIAQLSYLDLQEEIRRKQLETRQQAETSVAETEANIERVKQEKQTEALQVRLDEIEKRKQREQILAANELRRQQEQALEQVRLATETEAQKRLLELEQAITELEEERRLAETKAAVEAQRLSHEAELKRAEYEFEQEVRTQENALKLASLEVELNLKREANSAEIEMEGQRQALKHQRAQQEVEISRLEQEIANLANEQALVKEWIANLPKLAEQLPDIAEMKVLQMGEQDHLAAFLAQQTNLLSAIRKFLREKESND
jgi:flotillin